MDMAIIEPMIPGRSKRVIEVTVGREDLLGLLSLQMPIRMLQTIREHPDAQIIVISSATEVGEMYRGIWEGSGGAE